MFENATLLNQTTTGPHSQFGEEYRVSQSARQLYQRVRQQGRIGQIVARLTGHQAGRLIDLDDFAGGPRASRARHFAGIKTVKLSEIRGSAGRHNDFDAAFQPLTANSEQRWLRVATARQERLGLPPVQLIQVGDSYFLLDGHHRVSVARARGEREIEAEVTVWELA